MMMVRISLKEGYKVFAVVFAFAAFELAANAIPLLSSVILCESAAHEPERSCLHQDRSDIADHQYG